MKLHPEDKGPRGIASVGVAAPVLVSPPRETAHDPRCMGFAAPLGKRAERSAGGRKVWREPKDVSSRRARDIVKAARRADRKAGINPTTPTKGTKVPVVGLMKPKSLHRLAVRVRRWMASQGGFGFKHRTRLADGSYTDSTNLFRMGDGLMLGRTQAVSDSIEFNFRVSKGRQFWEYKKLTWAQLGIVRKEHFGGDSYGSWKSMGFTVTEELPTAPLSEKFVVLTDEECVSRFAELMRSSLSAHNLKRKKRAQFHSLGKQKDKDIAHVTPPLVESSSREGKASFTAGRRSGVRRLGRGRGDQWTDDGFEEIPLHLRSSARSRRGVGEPTQSRLKRVFGKGKK